MASPFRWHSASQVLAVVRRHPGITRAAMARQLHLASGLATEITARLRALRLLAETPAPPQGRGRPTTVLGPHPDGPVVAAIELRHEDWRCAMAALDGRLGGIEIRRHGARDPRAVLAAIRRGVDRAGDAYGDRLRAVSLAVAGTVHDGRLVQSATLGWGPVELGTLTAGTGLPLLLGNDATLAGVAEARTGSGVGATTALHLIVEVGVGGTLTVNGCPGTGAHGAAGEYGHVPFGDRRLRCPCGARGCWDLDVDGRALARHLGAPEPADPRSYARAVLDRTDVAARRALSTVAAALGGGIAGLVNIHDPDTVTLGGLGAPLRAADPVAFAEAYTGGLMAFHREQPPPVLDATHGDDGPLHGAALLGLDHVTTAAGLADWVAVVTGRPSA